MRYIIAFFSVVALVGIDQLTKYLVLQNLELHQYIPILGDAFGLYYLENEGMAWGLFQNCQWLFLIFTAIILVFLVVCYWKLQKDARFQPLRVCIVFLFSGAIGNMIDRIFHGAVRFHGAVVDFLYIKLIDFPVFNVADMYVTISVAVLLILLLVRYKEQDFQIIFPSAASDHVANSETEVLEAEAKKTEAAEDTEDRLQKKEK